MNRKSHITLALLALACAIAYAYSTKEEPNSVDKAHQDEKSVMMSLTNTPVVSGHAEDTLKLKSPVLE